MLLMFFSAAWLAGIFLGTRLDLPPVFFLLTLVPLPWLFLGRRYRKRAVYAALAILLCLGAATYAYASLNEADNSQLRYYNDSPGVELKGTVAADPDVRDKSARLTVAVGEILADGAWRPVSGRVLVTVPRYPAYAYGDVLRLSGDLETPPVLDDFDYRGYLAHQGIYSAMYYPGIDVADTGWGFAPLVGIYSLRQRIAGVLAEVLPEPQAALAQGILLGLRGNIPADVNEDFVRSGTAHLLAISGVNIGIMAGIVLGIGLWLFGRKRYLYVWLALAAVWFYTVITGFNPPVVRGAVMASIFLAAEALGRQRSGLAALTLAAAVMTGIHPYVLGDASFQLSFMAMAGLIFLQPVFSRWGRDLVEKRLGESGWAVSLANLCVDSFSATLAALIAVWPLIAYYFGLFSLAGPLATFLAVPVLPVIFGLGSLAGLAGLVWLPPVQILGWLTWPFLSWMILVAGGLGAPSIAAVNVRWINPAFLTGYYIVLAAAILLYNRKDRLRSLAAGTAGFMRGGFDISSGLHRAARWAIGPLCVIAALVAYSAVTLPGRDLQVSFLDVGQGDAALIQIGSRQVLIDGGPSPGTITAALGKYMPFWDRTIDLVVLTHSHEDHLAGLLEVLRRYRVLNVLYAPEESVSPLYDAWKELIREKQITLIPAQYGEVISLGEAISLRVINPGPEPVNGSESDIDNNSVALVLRDGAVSFLFTSDIMADAERRLIYERAVTDVDVLKVGHHGSDSSSTPAFLNVIEPEAAVISAGAGNRYGLPDADVVTRLQNEAGEANLYRTDEDGTVTFTTDGERLWLKTEK